MPFSVFLGDLLVRGHVRRLRPVFVNSVVRKFVHKPSFLLLVEVVFSLAQSLILSSYFGGQFRLIIRFLELFAINDN